MNGQVENLYEQAQAARERSRMLAAQLHATQRTTREYWQLIQAAWDHTEQIRAQRLASCTAPDRLRRSAYARLQARLASMPVIEQAKGVIMARYGWSEDQAFEALRRASQRENIKVRDLAARVVARTAFAAQRQPGQAPAGERSGGESPGSSGESARPSSGSARDRYRASA